MRAIRALFEVWQEILGDSDVKYMYLRGGSLQEEGLAHKGRENPLTNRVYMEYQLVYMICPS